MSARTVSAWRDTSRAPENSRSWISPHRAIGALAAAKRHFNITVSPWPGAA